MNPDLASLVLETNFPPFKKLLLFVVAQSTDSAAQTAISVSAICRLSSLSRRTAQQNLAELEIAGVLQRQQIPGKPNGYFVSRKEIVNHLTCASDDSVATLTCASDDSVVTPTCASGAHPEPGTLFAKKALEPRYALETNAIEPNAIEPNAKKTKTKTYDFDAEFELAWQTYPKRPGNSKADARKQWRLRIKQGVAPETMLAGIERYAKYVAHNQVEPRFVKLTATFLGPGCHFESDWECSAVAEKQWWLS